VFKKAMKILLKNTLTGHNASIYKLLNAGESTFYSLGGDGYLVSWNTDSDDGVLLANADDKLFSGAIISKDIVVAGGFSGQLYWLDINRKEIIKRVSLHKKAIMDCIVDRDRLCTVAQDGALVIWDITTMSSIATFSITPFGLRTAHFLDLNLLLIGGMDGYMYLVDTLQINIVNRWKAHETSIFSILSDDENIYTSGRDAMIRKWKQLDQSLQLEVAAHWFTVNTMIFVDQHIISASRDKKIRIWDENLNLEQSIDVQAGGHVNSVNSIIYKREEGIIATCSDDRTIKLWSILH
jgi:WD40 repeat protein